MARGLMALLVLSISGSLAFAHAPNHQGGSAPTTSASAHGQAIGQNEPLLWLRVLASLARGTPSQELIAEIKGRSIAFAFFFNPNDEINQEYVRSLGGTEGLIRAAREARNGDDDLTEAPKLQFAAAEADVRKALAAKPNKAVLHQLLGMALLLPQPKDAVAELRQAIALDPKSASSHLYLGLALMSSDNEDEASTQFRESLRLMPNQVLSHLLLYSLLKQKDKDGALAELKQALQIDPGAYPVHQDLGDYYLGEKEYDLAIPEYQTAIRLKASSFPAHSGLAQAFYAKGDYTRAIPEFQEYLRLDKRPGSENAHGSLASCFYQLGQFEQAAAEERTFLAAHPDDQNARDYLAACLYQLGQFEQAAAEARTVLAAHPDDQNAKGWLAAATSKMKSGNGGGSRVAPMQAPQAAASAGSVVGGTLIQRVDPVYPPEARNARVQGMVSLRAVIGVDGSVKELSVISGPLQLTQAALDAVRQWRYRPYLQNGQAVEVDTTINLNFALAAARPAPQPAVTGVPGSSVATVQRQTAAQNVSTQMRAKSEDIADLNSQLEDAQQKASDDETAAQEDDARVEQFEQQCAMIRGPCANQILIGMNQTDAVSKRQEAQSLQSDIQDLREQIQQAQNELSSLSGAMQTTAGNGGGRNGGACPDWSPYFDQIDNPAALQQLQSLHSQGWPNFDPGNNGGVSLQQSVAQGDQLIQQLQQNIQNDRQAWMATRSSDTATPNVSNAQCNTSNKGANLAAACQMNNDRNMLLGVAGMNDLMRCRAGMPGGPGITFADAPTSLETEAPADTSSAVGYQQAPNQPGPMPQSSLRNGGPDVQACLARKDAMAARASQLNAQKEACEKVEWKKEMSHLGTQQLYCHTDITGRGRKVAAGCGSVEYDCDACKGITIEAVCAMREANAIDCANIPGVK